MTVFALPPVDLYPVEAPPAHDPIPYVPPDACWEVVEGDGQTPALQMVDESFDARFSLWQRLLRFFARFILPKTTLPETNMTFPDRPIDALGRVSPQGKAITDVSGTPWQEWITDCIGERNAENFIVHGDGYCDTGAWRVMSATAGGNLRKVKSIITQAGAKWCILDLLDFHKMPEKRADGWYYNGERMTYRSHPQYFNVRTNRKQTRVLTWLTAGGINVSNDVGIEGGKGHEAWPPPVKQPVAQRLLNLWLYPSLPAVMVVYAESLIVDGERVEREGGILCMITKYRFHGPDVYGYDNLRGNWYKLSEMLVRGTLENRDGGNGFDLRCYSPSLIPNRRVCPAPDCGWLRP